MMNIIDYRLSLHVVVSGEWRWWWAFITHALLCWVLGYGSRQGNCSENTVFFWVKLMV